MIEPAFTENSRRIFDARYPRKGDDGLPTEAPSEVIQRVALNVASVNALYFQDDSIEGLREAHEFPMKTIGRQLRYLGKTNQIDRFNLSHKTYDEVAAKGWPAVELAASVYADMIARWEFLPNSPTWTGAGTPLGQLAACFVLPIADDLVIGPDSIFSVLRKAAAIQQTGGGNGFSFGRLRPKNSIIKRSMGQASGPVSFMEIYDTAFAGIQQGGSRRGANMGVLPVWHPDIEEFIEAKTVEGKVAGFNISVGITEEFMQAVYADKGFDLKFDGEVYRTINARELFDKITQAAWKLGDPGCLFLDRANDDNPCPTQYTLESTNPCGEQWLGPYENCCLGSIAVNRFVNGHYLDEGGAEFDWDRFAQVVEQATFFLDDVIDANQYVESVPELEEAAQNGRRIGLGMMGLADAMLAMGIRYGSEESLAFSNQLMEFARFHTMKASIDRARARGPFGWIENSIYDPLHMDELGEGGVFNVGGRNVQLWQRPQMVYGVSDADFGRPEIEWGEIYDGIRSHGIRNSAQMTFAPTGTISNVAMLEGSGCEPLFALAYVRTMMQEEANVELGYVSESFKQALNRVGIYGDQMEDILIEVAENGGSCQGIPSVPADIQRIFVVAADVSPVDHVKMQAVLQQSIDNSISKTINFPNSATVEEVAEVYKLAHEMNCKGITIYRQGSRDLEVLATTKKESADVVEVAESSGEWPIVQLMGLPDDVVSEGLPARVTPVETFYGKLHVTITEHPDHPGRPFDIRLQIGKAGNDTNAHVEALGRMISSSLRAGVDVREIVHQLEGIGGMNSVGFGARKVRSAPDGVAKLLRRRYLDDSTPMDTDPVVQVITETVTVTTDQVEVADICPDCNMASVLFEEGCRKCSIMLGGCGLFSGCD